MAGNEPPGMPPPPAGRSASGARPRIRWMWQGTLVGIVAVVAAIGAVTLFLASEAGLRFVVAEVVAASRGRLTVEGVEGSLLGTIRAHEIAWRTSRSCNGPRELLRKNGK